MKFIKPEIVISKCLEFDQCRYDGQIINNQHVKNLKKHINFKPVCPEVEIGMGVPRKPIKIIFHNNRTILKQSETNIDFSDKMKKFSNNYLNGLEQIDGFILKSSSPSCGLISTKIYSEKSPVPIKKASGLFAKKIIEKFPNHPKEEEKRLNNPFIREHFYTSIFTLADFRTVKDINTLYKFHAKHKYLLMSYNQILMTQMGNIAADNKNKKTRKIIKDYYDCLLLLFSKKSKNPANINTQTHIMGYFKKSLTSKEKEHFLKLIELYRKRKIPISSVNSILQSWIIRFENEYLMRQSFLNPFPKELIIKEKSRFL